MSISTPQAQKSVLLAMTLTVGLTYTAKLVSEPASALRNPGSMLRIAVGGVGVTLGLMFLANPEPDLARLFAWFVFMGGFYTYGAPVVDRFGKVVTQGNWKVKNTGGKPLAEKKATPVKPQQPPSSGSGGGGGGGSGW